MNKVYSVTYDLHRPGQNYEALYDALRSYGTYWHYQRSAWIIRTGRSAADVRDHLAAHIDSNDSLFVGRLSGEAAWIGLSDEGNWLHNVLSTAAT